VILRLVYQKAAVSRILKLFRPGKNSAAVFAQPGHLFGYTEAVLTSKEGDVKEDLARIEQFLDALWLERNLAENTLSAYRRDLTMVVEWLHHRDRRWLA
jgi:integrase/recombinase XerD